MPKKIVPVPVPPGHQWCFACPAALPITAFSPDSRRPNGVISRCRRCQAKARHDRRICKQIVNDAAERIIARQAISTPMPYVQAAEESARAAARRRRRPWLQEPDA